MNSSVKIEIKLDSHISRENAFELKNVLNQVIPNSNFTIREPPPLPGRMGTDFSQIIFYASIVATAETLLHKPLETISELIVEKINDLKKEFKKGKNLQALNISGYVKVADKKTPFKLHEDSITYLTKNTYSINPETTFVLLAGCGNFESTTITTIPAVENNISELYKIFTDVEYFGIPQANIDFSVNETTVQIQRKLRNAATKENIETLFFYFVGHGFCTDKDSYYLAAFDTEKEEDIITGGIDKEFIKNNFLNKSKAKQKIAIIDACYSGLLTQSEVDSIFSDGVAGSYVLSSSNANQVSFFKNSERFTFFTDALIKTIRTGIVNNKENISLDDLYLGTSSILKQTKLQAPSYNNGLNIDPSNFHIAQNPAYSANDAFEIEVQKIKEYYKKNDFEKAAFECKRIRLKHKDDTEINQTLLLLENEIEFLRQVTLGEYNLKNKKYHLAIDCFENALTFKDDILVRQKINEASNMTLKKTTSWWPKYKKTIIGLVTIFLSVLMAKLITSDFKTKEASKKPATNSTQEVKIDSNLILAQQFESKKQFDLSYKYYTLVINKNSNKELEIKVKEIKDSLISEYFTEMNHYASEDPRECNTKKMAIMRKIVALDSINHPSMKKFVSNCENK